MPDLPLEMQHAVQKVMPEGMERSVDVRLLPASLAVGTAQFRAAVKAVLLVRMAVARSMAGLDRTSDDRAGCRVPNGFEIRHHASPCAEIMRPFAVMLAAVP
jgi:hypothetical protein